MPSANATVVTMDVEKLYRCHEFFLTQLLVDRKCTFDVQEYHTSMDNFLRYYHVVSKEKPSCLADRFQITGSMPVRRAAYRFASTRTRGQSEPVEGRTQSAAGTMPPVPPHAWPPAVKKASEAADRIRPAAPVQGPVVSAATAAQAAGPAKQGAGGPPLPSRQSQGATATDVPLKWRKGIAQVPFVVHFLPNAGDASFGKPAAAALVASMRARNIRWLFLVTVGGITPYAARELSSWCCFEVWPLLACLCPAVTHQAFPAHRLLGAREKKEFYDKWKVTPAQVPRMQVSDAAAKYYGYVPGDVVAVTRNTFVGKLAAFRVVVHVAV